MRLGLLAALAAMLFTHGALAQAAPTGLARLLDAELARFAGPGGPYHAGIYIKHMATGEVAGVHADEQFDSASTIKMAILVMAYQMADRKALNLNERYIIKASDLRAGSGIFRYQDPGLAPTLRDILTQMVITSDNTATDVMLAKVGGKDAVNAWLKQNGYATTHLNHSVYTVFRRRYERIDPKYANLSPEDMFALASSDPRYTTPRKDLIARVAADVRAKPGSEDILNRRTISDDWLAVVTPAEMGRLLEGIEANTIASRESCDEMKRIMRAQQSGTRKIPHWLSVPVAHKTGENGSVTNDVGMIYARSGPIIIALYSGGYTGLAGDADDRLGAVARLVVEYFDGAN
jgi:beta-lactamase class A